MLEITCAFGFVIGYVFLQLVNGNWANRLNGLKLTSICFIYQTSESYNTKSYIVIEIMLVLILQLFNS